MKVYELMKALSELPAGAEVKTSICVDEDMNLFSEEFERILHAVINDVCSDSDSDSDIIYLRASDVED